MAERHDVVVVGAGAAGGWAAKELCDAGLTVLLLEAGRALDAATDFPIPPRGEARLRSRVAAALRGQPVQMRCAAFNARTRRFFVSDRQNPYTTPPGKPFNWFRGRQVGGRLHVWARLTPRLSDLELKAGTRDGHGVDWPLDHAELAPHYDRVEEFLGLRGERDGLAVIPDGRCAAPTRRTPSEERFKAAVESAFPERRVIAPRVVSHQPERVPSTLQAALDTGRLTLRPNAVVRRVSMGGTGDRATGVSFVDGVTRELVEAHADAVVLCASAIETLRILLNSESAHPGGLGNSSGRLGRGVMDNLFTGIGGPMPDGDTPPAAGAADPYDLGTAVGFQVPRFRNVEERHPAFARGYGVQGAIGRAPSWYLLAQGEMLARAENAVTLDPRRTDAWGIPAAHISIGHSSNEVAMAADQLEAMHEMAAAAGLRPRTPPSGKALDALAFRAWRRRLVSRSGAFLPGSAAHEIGGAGMGNDPGESVLNRFNQCWDVPNVFVTDGAAFPSGCWQNTTLTIMALTVRACGHLARELRAGRL